MIFTDIPFGWCQLVAGSLVLVEIGSLMPVESGSLVTVVLVRSRWHAGGTPDRGKVLVQL